MGGERPSRISELYHAALARLPEEREAFLQEACADDHRLHEEIKSLLGYTSDRFLAAPAVAAAAGPILGCAELPRDFGSYRLVAPLGSGGMGDVYRARDLKLGRDVAVKILPSQFMIDPERRARFAREARLLATLNHPHIGAIYGLEAVEGITALVLELVDGPTLADRLERGRLPMSQAVLVARQIAEALEAAHEKGIIHRDLKPSNIVIQGDGGVVSTDISAKVLDFGLAKSTTEALAGGLADATMSSAATIDGRILGTPAYMSPEQARGLPVDKRTDIWSFGCVLYEMLTARKAFNGETTTDVMAAVVGHDPDWTALPRETPPRVRLLLARCLQKDPKMRLRDIGDARIELVSQDEIAVAVQNAGITKGRDAKSRLVILAAASALSLAVIGAAWWYRHSFSSPQASNASSPSAVPLARPLRRLTFDPGQLQTDPTFSPDGRYMAYASDRAGNFDIWIQPLDGSPARPLTRSPEPETQPSWSHDGTAIVFRSEGETGGLFRISAQGGPATRLTTFGIGPMWSSDDSEILFRTGVGEGHSALFTVPADGSGTPHELARSFLHGGTWDWIDMHPDGRISALGSHRERGFGFYTLSRDGSGVVASKFANNLALKLPQLQPLARTCFHWNDRGTMLYVEAVNQEVRNIWRVRVSPSTLDWIAAEPLTTGSGADVDAALSRDGSRMVFAVEQQSVRLWAYPLDARAGRITGSGTPISQEEGRIQGGALSPDGEWAAYKIAYTGSDRIEGLMTNIRTGRSELVAVGAYPNAWSPDSRTLAYTLQRPGSAPQEMALATRDLDGPEQIIRSWNRESYMEPSSWTPDGRFVVGSWIVRGPSRSVKIASWPVAPSSSVTQQHILLENPERGLWQACVSPKDGRWLAFVAQRVEDPTKVELYIAREHAPFSEWVRVAPNHPWADKPRWSPDGKLLYFVSNSGSAFFNLWAVSFDPDRGALRSEPFKLTHFDSPALAITTNMQTSGIGISTGRAILPMMSARGHIWLLENVDR